MEHNFIQQKNLPSPKGEKTGVERVPRIPNHICFLKKTRLNGVCLLCRYVERHISFAVLQKLDVYEDR